MTIKQVELSVREFNKIVKSGKVLRTVTKNGQIFAEFNSRGANTLWMKDLAKMRGVKQADDSVRLRERIEAASPTQRGTSTPRANLMH